MKDVLRDKYVSPFLFKDDNVVTISKTNEAFFSWIFNALQIPVVVLFTPFA